MKIKKLWKYRFYGMILIGLTMLFMGTFYCRLTSGIIIWGIGFGISFCAVILQITFVPNFDTKCPDCNVNLEVKDKKLLFKKHST